MDFSFTLPAKSEGAMRMVENFCSSAIFSQFSWAGFPELSGRNVMLLQVAGCNLISALIFVNTSTKIIKPPVHNCDGLAHIVNSVEARNH